MAVWVSYINQGLCLFRATEGASTQFFQFDHAGNMYVFAPDTGATGSLKLVKPGDTLIFSSSYNPADWAADEWPGNDFQEAKLPRTCPADSMNIGHEFKPPLPDDALEDLGHKNFSMETMKQVRWVHKMYCEWHCYRDGLGLERILCDLEDKAMITVETLKFALPHFITEIKKLDGLDYPGKTLYHLVICIQFHLECQGFAFKLINDAAFKDLKYTLDNTMKARTVQGIGNSVKQAEVLSTMDEDLWNLGCLGMSNPYQLLNTVIFAIGKGFVLRPGKEHMALCGFPFQSQFTFMQDPDGEVFLRYTEDIGLKTNKGGLRHRKVHIKTVDLYATDSVERCPLRAIIKYLTLFPKARTCSAFYLQPRKKWFGKAWYVNRPAGINTLRNAVCDMCKKAGLPGYYTNYSLRSTAATKLYCNGIDEQLIMEITGYRSLAIRLYKRTSDKQRKLASNCLFRVE